MSLPGFAFVTPFILSQGEKGSGFNMFAPGFPSVSIYLIAGKKRGGFDICLYLAFPLSLHSSCRKVKRGG